jgi:hypothetical protein
MLVMVSTLAAQLQLLRVEAHRAAPAAYRRAWISVRHPRSAGVARHVKTTTCAAQERPREAASAHAASSNSEEASVEVASTVAIGKVPGCRVAKLLRCSGGLPGQGAFRPPVACGAYFIPWAFLQVMAAQANFVRVKVDSLEGAGGAAVLGPPPRQRLLCVVRGLLKKIKQTVLVGYQVRVVGIDWADGSGARGE